MKHALIGGAIGMVIATAGAVATWNSRSLLGPHWYPVSLMAGALPTAGWRKTAHHADCPALAWNIFHG